MKTSVIALLLTGLVAAQDFTGQPDCAIACLKDAIPKAGCALTDTACQCQVETQAKLVGLAAPCLISKCSPSDLAKAQSAAAAACKKDTTGSSSSSSSSTEASSHTSASESSSETTAAGSTTESTTEAGSTTDAGTTTTGPASTAATETTGSETTGSETTASETTASETTASSSSHATSAGHTSPTSPPGGVSNSTTSGVRSVVTRTSTAFVDGGNGRSQTSGAPASTTLAGSDASAPAAGILGAVLAALMAL